MDEIEKDQSQDIEDIFSSDWETPWYLKIYYWFYRNTSGLRFKLLHELPCFFRRGKKGYSYIDTWSFDSYLCDVIAGGVELLKTNVHGAPPDLFDSTAKNQTWKWEEILTKISCGFKAGKALVNMDYRDRSDWESREKELEAQFNEGMDLFRQYFFNLWD